MVNRHTQEPVRLVVSTTALGPVAVEDAWARSGPDPAAVNSESDQQRVAPAPLEVAMHEGTLTVELPAVSWACVRLRPL